jgi:hypothetical protein
MSRPLRLAVLALVACALASGFAASPAAAKKYRYAAGPQPTPDTTLSVAQTEVEPIVRAKGPKVPATNLQLIGLVANTAFERALASAPLDSTAHVTLAPVSVERFNYVVERAVMRALSKRHVAMTVRRQPLAEDSTLVEMLGESGPVLEYRLSSARVTYLRLVGWLPGRVKIERQALVEGNLALRDPHTLRVLWTGDATYNLLDSFPRDQLALVEDATNPELKAVIPQRNVDKLVEPVIVLAIITGLVLLFFQNRP